ncbi:hypothetical protein [Thalassobaculum sp.]|uniref:hypothetical protein n=1 Tax=Thalassobaculum sp. TaxID=2022740 RepID=UPI003B5D0211
MDIASYRLSESLGYQSVRCLRHIGIHGTGSHMIGHAFPYRLNSVDELVVLLDHMHENRFDAFVSELGGLSDQAMDELVGALVDYADFFLANFAPSDIPMPLSGMISQYAIARKLRGIPSRGTVLEIGPGTGLLSFFLSKDTSIKRYDSVEVMESFYLMQHFVNRHVYGSGFRDRAQTDASRPGFGGIAYDRMRAAGPGILDNDELPLTLSVTRRVRAEHFPWWQLEEVAERRYDVVMSNANLTEMNLTALKYYAALAASVVKPEGVFWAQCLGGGEIPPATALKTVIGAGFAPLAMIPTQLDGAGSLPGGKQMALFNVVFLPRGHPRFEEAARNSQTFPLMDPKDALTRGMFGLDEPKAPRRIREEVLAAVAERLA